MFSETIVVSVIIPIYNGEIWIDDCLESVLSQDILKHESIEISIYNDGSTDNTLHLLKKWEARISNVHNLSVVSSTGIGSPKGVGFAKNQAVKQSRGCFLCFQDVDDIMQPSRISKQLLEGRAHPGAIIGSQFKRLPENATERYTNWANTLPHSLLDVQIYTSHGPTVIMPTWFCSRETFNRVGQFSEAGHGTPEDLIFFYEHLDQGGSINRVDDVLLIYRHHPLATTFSISEETIWRLRLNRLEEKVLCNWKRFSIWNAGKQGRRFYRSLIPENRKKVYTFCDVDVHKIGKTYKPYGKLLGSEESGVKISIVHFSKVELPLVICVKLGLTNGEFEKNLKSLNLEEGIEVGGFRFYPNVMNLLKNILELWIRMKNYLNLAPLNTCTIYERNKRALKKTCSLNFENTNMAEKDLPCSEDSDEDYVPEGRANELSEEESGNESNRSASDDESPSKGPTKKKKRKIISKAKEKVEEEKPEEKKEVNVDALWADFKQDVNELANASKDSKSDTNSIVPAIKKTNEDNKPEAHTPKSSPSILSRPNVGKPKAGLSSILGQMGKKNKLTTLEKSKLDWNNFKKSEGIEDEIKIFNRGKDGYLEKQDFLQRSDVRQFEIEKQLRATKRSHR